MTKKYNKKLALLLYNNLNNNKEFENILNKEILLELLTDNSLLSLILLFFINNNNNNKIEYILNLNNINFMKRDYLNIIKYYYNIDYNKTENILVNNLLKDNTIILDSKDLDYLIKNKLFKCIIKMTNLFIISTINLELCNSVDNLELCNSIDNLELINSKIFLNKNILEIILKYIEYNLYENEIIKLNNFIFKNHYDIIIDFGNILYSTNGIINDSYLINLNKIHKLSNNYGKILYIIHIKHIKKYPDILNFLKQHNYLYYLTPYKFNDDIFTLWFFIKSNLKSFIISNDKFSDFINNINNINEIVKNDLFQFNNILKQQILNFNLKHNFLTSKPLYSKCIHFINNNIYILHISNIILKIKLI